MVLEPSAAVLTAMKAELGRLPSFDGGDAGFLNGFLRSQPAAGDSRPPRPCEPLVWHELSHAYNFTSHLVKDVRALAACVSW
jgi:hypothetical protein